MGLEGMIEDLILKCTPNRDASGSSKQSDYWNASEKWNGQLPLNEKKDIRRIARAISLAEAGQDYSLLTRQWQEGKK